MRTTPPSTLSYNRLTAMVCLIGLAAPAALAAPAGNLTLAYDPPPVFIVGVAIEPQMPQVAYEQQGTSTTYAVTAGALPAGLTLDPSTGTIEGTPTTACTGKKVKILATNGKQQASAQVTFTVTPAVD